MRTKGLANMYKIEVSGIEQTILSLKKFPAKFRSARINALYEAGSDIRRRVRYFIESSGWGTWKPPHPLTTMYFSSHYSWIRYSHIPGNFYKLGKFSRYIVKNSSIITGFGTDNHGGAFDPFLMRCAKNLFGATIPVTQAMRRKMAATKINVWRHEKRIPGITYFPLKKTTTKLVIPRRLIRFEVDIMVDIFTKALERNLDSKTV